MPKLMRHLHALTLCLLLAPLAQGAQITLTTSQSLLPGEFRNQGWWTDGSRDNLSSSNFNYLAGINAGSDYRNFFTFDLALLPDNIVVTGAELRVTRFTTNSANISETYALYDVSTDPAALNDNAGSNISIYDDLGTGTSYGTFAISTTAQTTDIASFNLNGNAIADLNAAGDGYFSIGGAVVTGGNLFAGSGNSNTPGVQELVITYIPEPTSLALLAVGAILVSRRHRR